MHVIHFDIHVKMWYFYTAHYFSISFSPSYFVLPFLHQFLVLPIHSVLSDYPARNSLTLLHVSPLHLLFLSSATGDPYIYRKPPIYTRTGTV